MIKACLHHSSLSSRDIALLLAVAEGGSIRRAAETIGIAQPSLSKNIRLIEQRLGVDLFERSASGSQPTLLGSDLMARGRQVLLDLQAIQRDLTNALRGETGPVRIGLGALVTPLAASRIVRTVRMKFPNISLDLHQLHPSDVLKQIANGEVDFGICHIEDASLGQTLQSQLLTRLPAVFFARRGHPLACDEAVAPARLADYQMTLPDSYARLEDWLGAFTGAPKCVASIRGQGFDLIGLLLEQSDDISIATPGVVDQLRRGYDLVELNVQGIDFLHEIHCVTPAGRPLAAAAQQVRKVVEHLLGPQVNGSGHAGQRPHQKPETRSPRLSPYMQSPAIELPSNRALFQG